MYFTKSAVIIASLFWATTLALPIDSYVQLPHPEPQFKLFTPPPPSSFLLASPLCEGPTLSSCLLRVANNHLPVHQPSKSEPQVASPQPAISSVKSEKLFRDPQERSWAQSLLDSRLVVVRELLLVRELPVERMRQKRRKLPTELHLGWKGRPAMAVFMNSISDELRGSQDEESRNPWGRYMDTCWPSYEGF